MKKDVKFFMQMTQNTSKFYANEWICTFDSVRKAKFILYTVYQEQIILLKFVTKQW